MAPAIVPQSSLHSHALAPVLRLLPNLGLGEADLRAISETGAPLIAIVNSRLERFAEGHVTFRYRDSRTGTTKRCTLDAVSFICHPRGPGSLWRRAGGWPTIVRRFAGQSRRAPGKERWEFL